ncbi:MAG: EamA family transporter [Proteobacteria bacterium]|nr:EamA family transporter [Pseudomonadota bacterium]
MSPAIACALGALICFGLGDLIYKQGAAAGAQPHQFLMLQSWVFTPIVFVYALATHQLEFVPGTLWGALAGVFILTGFYNFAYSLKTGSISINAPVFRLSFVITAALAVAVLGEPPTAAKAAGIALALAAAWLLLGGAGGPQREDRGSLIRVLVATVAVGIGNLIYKFGLQAGATPASIIVAQGCAVVVGATLFVAWKEGGIRAEAPVRRFAPRAAVVLAAAFSLLVEALARGQASVVVPVAQMGFVVTALVGTLFLGERFTLRKGAGLLAALAALASLAAG